jgi:hypothetical protein
MIFFHEPTYAPMGVKLNFIQMKTQNATFSLIGALMDVGSYCPF